jgi:hypothetical protein
MFLLRGRRKRVGKNWKELEVCMGALGKLVLTNAVVGDCVLGDCQMERFCVAGSLQVARVLEERVFARTTEQPVSIQVYAVCQTHMLKVYLSG